MDFEIAALCAGLAVGVSLFIVGLLASADAEGRGGNYAMGGVVGLVVAVGCLGRLLWLAVRPFA